MVGAKCQSYLPLKYLFQFLDGTIHAKISEKCEELLNHNNGTEPFFHS